MIMNLPEKGTSRFNYQELLHPDLYGSLPSASRPELPVLEPIETESIAPIRLVPFHEEPHPLTPAMKKLLKNVSDLN
jgi:hypothetical protein